MKISIFVLLAVLLIISCSDIEEQEPTVTTKSSSTNLFSGTPCENAERLQALLDIGGTIDLTSEGSIDIDTRCLDTTALVIRKETTIKFDEIRLLGELPSTEYPSINRFDLFTIDRGSFNVVIDGKCIPPVDGNPTQPDNVHNYPNLIDLWNHRASSDVSGNDDVRIITLKNSNDKSGYWCNIIYATGGGTTTDGQTINLENVSATTRGGGITWFSGNRPKNILNLIDTDLTYIIKEGQEHYGHLGYIHETINSNFNNVILDGCHFDFRSTNYQDDGDNSIYHNFNNVIMKEGISMVIDNGTNSVNINETTSQTSIDDSEVRFSVNRSNIICKNSKIYGASINTTLSTLGGNYIQLSGNDNTTNSIDFSDDDIAMASFDFNLVGSQVTISDKISKYYHPKVPNGNVMISNEGIEVVYDPTLDNPSYWTILNGEISNGKYISNSQSSYASGFRKNNFIHCGDYVIEFDLVVNAGNMKVELGSTAGSYIFNTTQHVILNVTDITKLEFNTWNLGGDWEVDNISIKKRLSENFVSNGDFSDMTYWTINNGNIINDRYESGNLTAYQNGFRHFPFNSMGNFLVEFDLILISGNMKVELGATAGTHVFNTSQHVALYVSDISKLEFNAFNLGGNFIIDNISIRRILN